MQGDSELDGTGIETSINGRFKLTLHKKDALPKIVQARCAGLGCGRANGSWPAHLAVACSGLCTCSPNGALCQPPLPQNLTHPLIEQPDSFVVQGYTYAVGGGWVDGEGVGVPGCPMPFSTSP